MINVNKMFGKSRFIKIKELQSFAFIEAKLFMRELERESYFTQDVPLTVDN